MIHLDNLGLDALYKAQSTPLTAAEVVLVDSDPSSCEIVAKLLAKFDLTVTVYSSAQALLNDGLDESQVICLLIDTNLIDMNGVELLERLNQQGISIPTIITACGSDVSTAVRAMRAKAIDFMEKPLVGSLLQKKIKLFLALRQSSND